MNIFFRTALTASVLVASAAQAQSDTAHADEQWGMFESYCVDCHNFEDYSGGLAFDLMSADEIPGNADVFEKVVKRLRGRLMPPPGSPQPAQSEINDFVGWMENTLDDSLEGVHPGHVPLQRLNRTEYEIAVSNLIGVDLNAADYLPTDIETDGFDNIAEALTTSPAFLEQFVYAARQAAREAVGEPVPKMANVKYDLPPGSQTEQRDGFPLGTRGGMKVSHNFPADGEYRISILDLDVGLYPRSLEEENIVVMLIGGEEVFRGSLGGAEDMVTYDQKGADGRAEIMERFSNIPVDVKAGSQEIVVTLLERSRAESSSWVDGGFGGLRQARMLDGIEISGPYNASGLSMSASRQKIFSCYPESEAEQSICAQRIIEDLASKAFRRPATAEDVERLLPFYESGLENNGVFDEGIEHAVAAILSSPDFLFRSLSPNPDNMDQDVYALSDLQLASRLSYFLWSESPDEELMSLAQAGELQKPEVLEQQVERMLDDNRASRLVSSFAMKWLNVDDLSGVDPDNNLFPGFSESLRDAFSTEIEMFLGSILLEDRPVQELLTADHSFLNEQLAQHYGIAGVHGPQFRRVVLEDPYRFGLLGKGAILLSTSYGDRTSPVLRGAWVLERLMGTPPTPPPPNVVTDLSVPEGEMPTTVRARLEQHRDNPSCNQCHGVIDPIGLALENFTVTGQWRNVDRLANNALIDASTVLPNGTAIEGPVELRQQLLSDPSMFAQAMTEKLMMYAINRELAYYDMPQVRTIVRNAEKQDYRLSSLIKGIVQSDAFRYQEMPDSDASNIQVTSK